MTNNAKIGDAVKVVTAGDHRLVVDSGLKFVMGWRPVWTIYRRTYAQGTFMRKTRALPIHQPDLSKMVISTDPIQALARPGSQPMIIVEITYGQTGGKTQVRYSGGRNLTAYATLDGIAYMSLGCVPIFRIDVPPIDLSCAPSFTLADVIGEEEVASLVENTKGRLRRLMRAGRLC